MIWLLSALIVAQHLKASFAFSAAEHLSAPHCAQFGLSSREDGSWRAVANTALQCQRACFTSSREGAGAGSLSLFSGAVSGGQPCRNFTFFSDTKLCYLSGSGSSQVKTTKEAHAISGPKDCPAEIGAQLEGKESLLFIPDAAHFNGQSELFAAAVQASQFAARHAVEEAKDATMSELLQKTGAGSQQSFAHMDLDKNGMIEPTEFRKAFSKLMALGGNSASFEKVDLNKDSEVNLIEFQQAWEGRKKTQEEIVTLSAGAARDLALKGGLPYVQQELCAAAAAAAAGFVEGRLQGKDLQSQTIAAADAVAADLPKSQQMALRCLAAGFSAGLATAGAKSCVEAARHAAWKSMVQSDWNEQQREEVAAQVAGVAAGLHAQAKDLEPHAIRQAIERAVVESPGTVRTKRQLIEPIVTAMATEWKVENAKHITDPVAANLVWAGQAFHQAFQASKQQDRPSSAAQRAADFLNQGKLTSHLAVLQEAAKTAQEKKLQQGASVVEQAAAAAEAVKKEAKKLNKSSIEEDRLVLGAVGAAVRLGAPEAQSEELAGLVQKAAAKEGFSKLAQAEASAWASATADSPEATTGELSAETAAVVQPEAKALRGVQSAAASVAIDGSWHTKNNLGDLMKSEESFEKQMSTRLGREDLVHARDTDEASKFRIPLWLPIVGASLCCIGMVLGLLTWKQKKTKKSQRMASLEINYQEVEDALNCKDCEIASEMVPSPVASLGAASPMSSKQLDIALEALAASPMSMSPQASPTSATSSEVATSLSPRSVALTRPMPGPELQPQQPGPLLISYPDWQQSWKPGEQQEVNYQVPPGARPGSTLLVDVGNGLAVPTLVPESAYAGLTLTLRR